MVEAFSAAKCSTKSPSCMCKTPPSIGSAAFCCVAWKAASVAVAVDVATIVSHVLPVTVDIATIGFRCYTVARNLLAIVAYVAHVVVSAINMHVMDVVADIAVVLANVTLALSDATVITTNVAAVLSDVLPPLALIHVDSTPSIGGRSAAGRRLRARRNSGDG